MSIIKNDSVLQNICFYYFLCTKYPHILAIHSTYQSISYKVLQILLRSSTDSFNCNCNFFLIKEEEISIQLIQGGNHYRRKINVMPSIEIKKFYNLFTHSDSFYFSHHSWNRSCLLRNDYTRFPISLQHLYFFS